MVPRFIPVAEPSIGDREIAAVVAAVKSGWVSSLGQCLVDFEAAFARYIGVTHGLSTMNGTTALHLALEMLGIGPGDEVIVPDLTFVATANAVTYTGATPVFADIDALTWCVDPDSIRKLITRQTKAIVPVHLYGHPADMDAVQQIADEFGLRVVEDAAEAHGAEYKGRKVGSLGDVAVFSFYGNKIITTGEGGMVLTNRADLYERGRSLRDHAMSTTQRYWHTEIGYNYRMTNLQAALGLAQLERIEDLLCQRAAVLKWYQSFLSTAPRVTLNPAAPWAKPVCWMVCAVLEGVDAAERDRVCGALRDAGIDTRPFFHPLSALPMYRSSAPQPRARDIAARGLNLPSSPSLPHEDVAYITTALRDAL
ncbi:MAG TPA: DegT/DnrJ/EryC1/StrS aminotransferase family protein [Gemmatimonadales bacterium]|nr:DegT/DnrJ/EryC1/StrS aminotransferase family protein [Gemmatimonadales bacterium]